MTTRPLKVGVIGCGGIAQMMHLPHLNERPDLFDIKALCDVKRDVLDAVGQRYHVKELHQDPLKVINNPEVEAVLLLASGSHFELTRAAIECKKHLFVEKPLGYGVKEAEELVRTAKAAETKTLIAYHKRFDPAFHRAREVVKAMGSDLRLVEVTVLHPDDGDYRVHHAILPHSDKPRAKATENYDLKGAQDAVTTGPLAKNFIDMVGAAAPTSHRVAAKVLMESLVHDLNLVRGVLGEPETVISSSVWREGFAQTSLSRFAGDVHANLSWILVPGVRNYEERVRFIGSNSRVSLVFPSPYLKNVPTPFFIERMEGDELVVESRTVNYEEAFRAELHAFRDLVVANKPAEVPVQDAVGDAAWVEAIARGFSGGQQAVRR